MSKGGLLASLMTLLVGTGTSAGEVSVIITGVSEAGGEIRIAACDQEHFLEPRCFRSAATPARAGEVEVTLRDVPPGTYALQAFHDLDEDGKIDTNFLGMPSEGMGFSNDAQMRLGPPDFADAAVTVGRDDATFRFTMRYFD